MIRTEQVEVTFGRDVHALRSCSIDFKTGAFTVLLGASGAGKSTLLRTLNGLVRPTRGTVIASGVGDLSERKQLRHHRRNTGMVFQQHHLIGRLTVLENVLIGRLGYLTNLASLWPSSREERRLALQAIERVGLLDHALRRADRLSGGQQQRVGIARALVQQPRLLLADEPVASLDPATAEQLLTLLHGICRADNLTVIISLHQVDLARRFADRIIGLQAGSVTFDGPPDQLEAHQAGELYGKPMLRAVA